MFNSNTTTVILLSFPQTNYFPLQPLLKTYKQVELLLLFLKEDIRFTIHSPLFLPGKPLEQNKPFFIVPVTTLDFVLDISNPEKSQHQQSCEHCKRLKHCTAMKHKSIEKVERVEKDYGQDLLHTIVFLIALLAVLWYLKV